MSEAGWPTIRSMCQCAEENGHDLDGVTMRDHALRCDAIACEGAVIYDPSTQRARLNAAGHMPCTGKRKPRLRL